VVATNAGGKTSVAVEAAPGADAGGGEQQADRGRRQRLGGGADPEFRAWRDGHPLLEIRPAKAFGPDDVAADADRHRQSRQVLLGNGRTGERRDVERVRVARVREVLRAKQVPGGR
jgi:hypothetical protein